jgi:hypothetical protein
MSDDTQYPPVRWHANTETPKFRSRVTWIGKSSSRLIDGTYDGGNVWRPDSGGKETLGPDEIVQWRYRSESVIGR